MTDGRTPGNGKTNPFGDGRGGGGQSTVAGNNFLTNPGGSASGQRPRDFQNASRRQSAATPESRGLNSADAAPGAPTAAQEAAPGPDSGHDAGTGTVGNPGSPFRVGG